ncbi:MULTISPECIES: hypothetical protein [Acinetobacter]|jgi:uncharacterized protein YydD (DUF2326 family)|nr:MULTISPECIES: hypothetical protein [Acinetobacter]ENX25903.1 hypothetical protein F891_03052 [Acinetobacter sp. CIP 101966]MBO2812720.1 hypothetical protein [Acinetobacter baumannii]MBO2871300.1 hypothetical protein [Acinetobacter baumannii]
MYLKYLSIKDKDNNPIQHVEFKKGINIIKGEKSNNTSNTKTNSLGKTTLLRCVDFCLAGKWSSFVFDKELKDTKNNTVFNFLKETLPSFELVLADTLENKVTKTLKITRSLTINQKAKKETSFFSTNNFINGELVSEAIFEEKIKKMLFDFQGDKPSLRQLTPKFIRTSDHQISNIIKYLHPSTSSFEYELLHLFLFDFPKMDIIHERTNIEHTIGSKSQEFKYLNNTLSTGKREINDVKKIELLELKSKYDSFQISKEYDHENDALNKIQEKINKTKAHINELLLDKDVWEKRLAEMLSKSNSIDTQTIEYIYKEAQIYNIDIQKKFEETVIFHQKMIENEVEFIKKSVSKSKEAINSLELEHAKLAEEYSVLLNQLAKTGSLTEYTNLGHQINELTKEIAETESLISQREKTSEELASLKQQFNNLTIKIEDILEKMRIKITIFNRYFSEYSKILTDDSYYIVVNKDKLQHFTLIPSCERNDSNIGDGSKQSVIIAFDLAYVSFANDHTINLTRPHFFTQDKIEIIDVNILDRLINLINRVDCQFIFPIISDKLDGIPDFDDSNIILTLSEDNKFFNIEKYNSAKKGLISKSIIDLAL